ncbi:MAG: methionine--tRNA ligase [Calditrichia bacterium]
MEKKKYLVTAALPYANGPIHLGHLAGAYLPADVFVRYCRMQKRDVIFICGTDEHGVPITITAEKQGKTPQQIVDYYYENIKQSFERFGMSFDNFSRTSLPIHHETAQEFFLELYKKGYFSEQTQQQLFCEHDNMFLADRYIEGTCPYCHSENARGDQCENCGKWIEPTQLIQPKCKICGHTPIVRETKHWFFRLPLFQKQLEEWIHSKKDWRDNVISFCNKWFKEGLQDRAITRDLDWGIKVPLEEAKGKVLYVWFEAPIGYISSTKEWAQKIGKPEKWKEYWQDTKNTKLVHFIGKDNIVFHAIIFPAMLMGHGDYVLPYNVPANEFLNLEGNKLSTSRNYAVWLEDYLSKFDADSLRYTLASNAPETKDTDFSWKDFQARHNNELADILGNFINRTATFISKYYDNKVPTPGSFDDLDQEMLTVLKEAPEKIGQLFDNYQLREATKSIMDVARFANKYFNDQAPWKSRKENPEKCATTLYVCIQVVRSLAILFHPILPFSAQKIWDALNLSGKVEDETWQSAAELKVEAGHSLNAFPILFKKLEDDVIQAEIDRLKQASEPEPEIEYEELIEQITIEDFLKVDLRVGKVLVAEAIPKANKLLRLEVDLGFEKRQLVAGIAQHYKPEDLIGKEVVVVANLKPAKLRGVESQGMILAVKDGEKLSILQPADEVNPGMKVS